MRRSSPSTCSSRWWNRPMAWCRRSCASCRSTRSPSRATCATRLGRAAEGVGRRRAAPLAPPARGRRCRHGRRQVDAGRLRQHRAPAARAGLGDRPLRVRGVVEAARDHAGAGARGADQRPRQPARDRSEPGEQVPGAREVRPRSHRTGAPRQARSGDRPRRGGAPRHPGAVAPHQEQPGADRRARRRQDRHRRGAGPADRPRRRARRG